MTVDWLDRDQHILLWTVEGKWSWEQFDATFDDAAQSIREVAPERADTISLMVKAGTPPSNALAHVRQATMRAPANWKLTVIVGGGPLVKALLGMGMKIDRKLGEKYALADSLDDALALIAAHRRATSAQPTRKPV